MEKNSFFYGRSVFRVFALALICLLFAHQAANSQQATPKTNDAAEDPNHFDPDDLKTFDDVVKEDKTIKIRDIQFTLHLYRPRISGDALPAIYICGDGGWRGLAPRTAEQLAHIGFAVAGVDSKVYLRNFSSVQTPLTIKQLASDYAQIANAAREYANTNSTSPVYLYGWSLGAGFAVAIGSEQTTRANWAGIVPIGLPAQNQLVSGVNGNSVDLSKNKYTNFGFRTEDLMPAVSPLPVVMIQSTNDSASPEKVLQKLFAAAKSPKKLVTVKASNHRFSGGREDFYAALAGAQIWIKQVMNQAKENSSNASAEKDK